MVAEEFGIVFIFAEVPDKVMVLVELSIEAVGYFLDFFFCGICHPKDTRINKNEI